MAGDETREKRGYAMNLKEQTYVCVLAECGNITKAAERLFISQPALSIYISTLEKNLGVRLFDRSGKRFTLTCGRGDVRGKGQKDAGLEGRV